MYVQTETIRTAKKTVTWKLAGKNQRKRRGCMFSHARAIGKLKVKRSVGNKYTKCSVMSCINNSKTGQ